MNYEDLYNKDKECLARFEYKSKEGKRRGREGLIFGVGINDSHYEVQPMVNGKRLVCPYYKRWKSVLKRSHSVTWKSKNPTYSDVTVCDEWLTFSLFKVWMEKHDWFGKELDKDIILTNNKIYSPETCMFVRGDINRLLLCKKTNTNGLPIGAYFHKSSGKYRSEVSYNGNSLIVSHTDTPEEASAAFLEAKAKLVREVAMKQEPFLQSCLLRIAGEIERGEYYS